MAAKKGSKRNKQEVLVTIMGSGPANATFESMPAAGQANGLIYAPAVHRQQITNIVGMAMTAKSVHYMLDSAAHDDTGTAGAKRKKR